MALDLGIASEGLQLIGGVFVLVVGARFVSETFGLLGDISKGVLGQK